MGGGAKDQGQIGADPRPGHGFREMASLPIPDELLADIFLRLPSPADLARASAACVSFRRVAADRAFLRRYRKIHSPPLLGFLEHERKVFHPAIAPHPSASAASAAALSGGFSFSFLPAAAAATDWVVRDTRDGRVLLDSPPEFHDLDDESLVFPETVVCDPLHRLYVLLPPIPAHLTAMVEAPIYRKQYSYCETFLAPHGEEETSFSVVWMAQCRDNLVVFVFSSSTGQWRVVSSQSWSDLLAGLPSSQGWALFTCRQYAYGCFYWVSDWRERLLVLDTRTMEFSIAQLPREARGLGGEAIGIVEAGEGRLGIFAHPQYGNYLHYTIRQSSGGSSSQWQFEKTISLDSRYLLMGSTGRHLFLYQRGLNDPGCSSLDVKTFQIQRVFVSNSCIPIIQAYSNFPPSLLSTPTVSMGVENEAEKKMLEQGCDASSSAQLPLSE